MRPPRTGWRLIRGPVADQEPESARPLCQLQEQVPRLLRRPRAAGVRGHAQEMPRTGAYLDDEEHEPAAQRDGAIDMEEAAGEHGRGLGAQELPQAVRLRRGTGGIRGRLSIRRTVGAPTPIPRPGSSPWIRW
jgi:hypothetical protein